MREALVVVVDPSCCFSGWRFLDRVSTYDTAIVRVHPKKKLASRAVLEDVLDAILASLCASVGSYPDYGTVHEYTRRGLESYGTPFQNDYSTVHTVHEYMRRGLKGYGTPLPK